MVHLQIKQITSQAALDLRQKVLRPGKARQDAIYPYDDAHPTFHLAAFVEGQIGCVATFIKEDHRAFSQTHQYRLRGMATDPKNRGQGLGRAVLEKAFTVLNEKNCHFLWCYAREVAFDFYLKLGFSFEGDFFDIPEIGPHKIMYREI